jgi:hypothetical protein
MPYIKQAERTRLDKLLAPFKPQNTLVQIKNAGELNYIYTKLALQYVKDRSFRKSKYLVFCMVMGTFICAALEFYRRWVVPYEDLKITENGDVT